jgi:hypothetical protein
LISKFLHFFDKNNKDAYCEPPEQFKIHDIIEMLCQFSVILSTMKKCSRWWISYLMEVVLVFSQYPPPKPTKFGVQFIELRGSMSGYLWGFMIYSRAKSDFTNIGPPGNIHS